MTATYAATSSITVSVRDNQSMTRSSIKRCRASRTAYDTARRDGKLAKIACLPGCRWRGWELRRVGRCADFGHALEPGECLLKLRAGVERGVSWIAGDILVLLQSLLGLLRTRYLIGCVNF